MGSLNGDTTVVRNGRSTSQISIYNYPEHLNPFYEGDQHKRLRFWKINKNALNEGRRNSFSISNLKDMWAFKSFRLKKKSSTLGINKTSESPPPLRRELQLANGWNTFDHRLRPSSNSPSVWNENFERNTICRTSLQNMPPKANGFGLNRNDNYRSTIQYGGMRSNYLSPQSAKQQTPARLPSLQLRSSHGSLVSTNPFDSDNENNDLNISEMQTSSATSTLSKRTPRKKKRAPAPPTPVLQTSTPKITTTALHIANDSSQNDTKEELCIREDGDIANLTAQIEHFVDNINKENINNNNADVPPNAIATSTSISTPQQTSPTHTNNNNSQNNQKFTKATTDQALQDGNDKTRTYKSSNGTATTITTTNNSKAEVKIQQQQWDPKETANSKPANDHPKHVEVRMQPKSNSNSNLEHTEHTEFSQTQPLTTLSKATAIPDKQINIQKNAGAENVCKSKTLEMTQSNIKGIPKHKQTNDYPNHIDVEMQSHANPVISSDVLQKDMLATNLKDPNTNNGIIKKNIVKHNSAASPEITSNNCEQMRIQENTENTPPPIPAALRSKSRKTPILEHRECLREEHPQSASVNGLQSQKLDSVEKITAKTSFILVNPPRNNNRTSLENLSPKEGNRKYVQNGGPMRHTANELVITEDYFGSSSTTGSEKLQSPNGQTDNNHQPKVEKPIRCNKTNIITVPRPPRRVTKTENAAALAQQQQKQQPKLTLNIEEAPHPSKRLEEIKIQNISNNHLNSTSNVSFNAPTPSGISNNRNATECESDMEVQLRNNYAPQQLEWKQSTLAPLETNIPPEKRKSVKDIIESINRSQRLLHTTSNRQFQMSPQLGESTRRSSNKLDVIEKPLNETQKEIKRLVEEIDILSNKHSISSPMLRTNSNSSNNLDKPHNDEIFQKCKVNKEVCNYRESSPISANLDWNPLPKPKRTKTFD